MQEQQHGNKWEKWRVEYDKGTNRFSLQNLETNEYHILPVVRDVQIDLALYLRRLKARDDKNPVTIKHDTYKLMAQEIIDRSDNIVYIRKGKWKTTVLTIKENTEEILDNFLKSTENFKDFIKLLYNKD